MLDPEEPPSSLCDPKDSASCVDFCSRLAPDCATPWFRGTTCLLPSEEAFRREIFRRDTADRPEAVLQGRVSDDANRRIEGAKVRVWFQGAAVADEISGKDGAFRVRLRSATVPYALRISHPGHATDIAELRLDRTVPLVRSFRLGPESTLRGRVVDGAGIPVPRVEVRALRGSEDLIEVSAALPGEDGQFPISGLESRRNVLAVSRFGWLPASVRSVVAAWAVAPVGQGARAAAVVRRPCLVAMGKGGRIRHRHRHAGRTGVAREMRGDRRFVRRPIAELRGDGVDPDEGGECLLEVGAVDLHEEWWLPKGISFPEITAATHAPLQRFQILHEVGFLLGGESERRFRIVELDDGVERRRDPVVEVGRVLPHPAQRRRAIHLRRAPRRIARRIPSLWLAHDLGFRCQPAVCIVEGRAAVSLGGRLSTGDHTAAAHARCRYEGPYCRLVRRR